MRAFSFLFFSSLLHTIASASPFNQSIPYDRTVVQKWSTSASIPASHADEALNVHTRRDGGYWYESASHGISAFGDSGYQVFRNVKDYGAVGDGVTDDTEAINRAITDGNRCGEACGSSSITPAVVYFPSGTYLVSAPLIQYYYTQFVGNPNALPTLKAAPTFAGIGVISANTYIPGASGAEWYVPQSNFYRQIRNFIIDISGCPNVTPDGYAPTGIHWQVGQATSIENVEFVMSRADGTTHVGIFMENGSGGYLGDLTFTGGAIGMWCGSQQFTSRNLKFRYCVQAIEMIWDWGWTWHGLDILLCQIGINVTALTSATAEHNQGVAAIAVLDSVFTNVPIAVLTSGRTNIMLENVQLNNAPIAIGYSGGPTVLPGGDVLIDNYGNGNNFIQNGETLTMNFLNGAYSPSAKSAAPSSLRSSAGWFARSKPQYQAVGIGGFIDIRAAGAAGNGRSDDTAIINSILASAGGSVVYFPHGTYMVSDTVLVPPGTKIVGEAWSEIMGFGDKFSDISNPRVMIRVGKSGDVGDVEISDMLFTVQGATAGAILMEWNLAQASQGSAGMWDAHFRVGGGQGSNLQYADCPWTQVEPDPNCIAATTLFHITSSASLYLENVWVWTADHDLDIPSQDQVSVYAARCLLIESQGPVWLWGTGAEHCTLYQYRFYHAKNIFAATLQTETPYYQPTPKAPAPFTGAFALPDDPTFTYCNPDSSTCAYAWGLEVIGSSEVMIYGAGFYSWFQWYSQACLSIEACQERVTRVIDSNNVFIANLYTKGVFSMIQGSSSSDVLALENMDGFLGTIVGWTGLDTTGTLDAPSSVVPLPPWIWDVPSPTVSCHIPCVLQPPPTPIRPIRPPPYTTTISGSPVVVTPPVIETPGLPVQPISVVVGAGQTVTPIVVPNPVVTVPLIVPTGGNWPGGPPPILPPPIPIPIPPAMIPNCMQFCSADEWPPVLPPIVVVPGAPLPVGAPPPPGSTSSPEGDDSAGDEEQNEDDCGMPFATSLTNYPSPGDVPDWGQSTGETGGKCNWAGTIQSYSNTWTIAIPAGKTTVDINLYNLLGFGSYGYDLDGATVQASSVSVTGWNVLMSPSSTNPKSSTTFVDFDIPSNPLPTSVDMVASVQPGTSSINLHVEIRASKACGGNPIPDPAGSGTGSSPIPPIFPHSRNPDITCGSDSVAGAARMVDCLFPYGGQIVQGQVLQQWSTITTQNPSTTCIRSGTTTNTEGVVTNNWCLVAQYNSCAFVISDKLPSFGGFPGYSVISGQVMRDFTITAANQCSGTGKTAIAAGPFQPFEVVAQSLCLTSPDHPEICGVP
ncbi:hypothetical protein POX_e06250 [Penicillium oxalicum]|uniref:hypothetical protein n=1 Tax=Penicillium oxalicum TaxID=69781 RepID=UPI0020B76313|nr:hypothetical protein POX_e06250 [Penicillium oxalicum]KAI2788237.1 hypothetical protein POX_e06250 [Penicillium oxalicum]